MTRKAATKAPAKDKAKAKAPSLYPWRFRTLVFFIGIAFAAVSYTHLTLPTKA